MHRLKAALLSLALVFPLAACLAAAEQVGNEMVGGANSPAPSPPPTLAIATGELSAGSFAVRVPTGSYTAPKGGAPNYSVPGPIVAFKGPDGAWRGHGYLETYPRLLKFEGKLAAGSAELVYSFEQGKTYKVRLQAKDGAVLLDEESTLGPRNVYVFDCSYGGWLPAAGFALNLTGERHAFLYLPCYYDKPEVTINPVGGASLPRDSVGGASLPRVPQGGPASNPEDRPGAVAVVSADAAKKDVAGFWCRDVASWRNGDRMGIQLWQRRQLRRHSHILKNVGTSALEGDPSSRHFLGPETKSDSTPNPRTAALLGKSLYEGHVTIELALGDGTRKLGFAVAPKPAPDGFKAAVQANR